jgi:hypothetical protein
LAGSDSLADILERVLGKGVVIVGDIGVNVVDVELLTLRIRLFIASAQTAREMGMDWWTNDPYFSSKAPPVELYGIVRARHPGIRADGPSHSITWQDLTMVAGEASDEPDPAAHSRWGWS